MSTEKNRIPRPGLLTALHVSESSDALRLWQTGIDRELVSVNDALICRDIRLLCGGKDDLATNALLAAMCCVLNQGSLCLPMESRVVRNEIERLCGGQGAACRGELHSPFGQGQGQGQGPAFVRADENPPASSYGRMNIRPPETGFEPAVIDDIVRGCLALVESGDGLFSGRPATSDAPWPIKFQDGRLYFSRLHGRERHLLQGLRQFRDAPPTGFTAADPDHSRIISIIDAVSHFNSIDSTGRQVDVVLNAAQKQAVMLALRKRFLVVSGGPGTGKTRILASLLVAWRMAFIDPIPDAGVRAQAVRRILLTAPTGRAGKRMGESISAAMSSMVGFDTNDPLNRELMGLSGQTIHRALGFNPWSGFVSGGGRCLPYDLVVCDEVSMVDVALMDEFVSSLREGATLVFMGDRDQLPSVEAGAVLGDIIPRREVDGRTVDFVPEFTEETLAASLAAGILDGAGQPDFVRSVGAGPMSDAVVMLTRSYRTGGNVTRLAARVNAGDTGAFDDPALRIPHGKLCRPEEYDRGSFMCSVVEQVSANSPYRKKMVTAWLAALYDRIPGLAAPVVSEQHPGQADTGHVTEDNAVLPIFKAIAKVRYEDEMSLAMHRLIDALFDVLDSGRILCVLRQGPFGASGFNRLAADVAGSRELFFPGCPVMVTRNLYPLNLFNGETGIVMKGAAADLVGVFRQGDGFVSHPLASLGDCLPAFAGTVHKSQGSEYRNVIVVLPDDPDHRLMTREILYTAMTRSSNNVWIIGGQDVLSAAIGRRTSRYSGLDLWS